MKPPGFAYHAPRTVDEAVETLAGLGDDAKVLAGGQSLLPLLNMRLTAPGHIVDINGVAGLDEVVALAAKSDAGAAGVRVGATARQAAVERCEHVATAVPLLPRALRMVAHPVVRNRGTVVGSLAHADPAAELPAVATVLDASVRLLGPSGERIVPAREFFVGPLESALRPDELALSVFFPALPDRQGLRWGTAFDEVARRHGDYALAGVAAVVAIGEDERISEARIACFGVGGTPIPLDLTSTFGGAPAADCDWSAAADQVRDRVRPDSDIHASADYRRHLAGILVARALRAACADAQHSTTHRVTPRPGRTGGRLPTVAPAADRLTSPDGDTTREITIVVNETPHTVRVPVRRLLSDCLRSDLRLTGTHVGCEHGVCGCCTVLLGGAPARSCLTLAVTADGHEITTVEGLAPADGELSALQRAFAECHALQCGFCTPGFLMTARSLLARNPNPSEREVVEGISGNLCRCTGYQNIVAAIRRAARDAQLPAGS